MWLLAVLNFTHNVVLINKDMLLTCKMSSKERQCNDPLKGPSNDIFDLQFFS